MPWIVLLLSLAFAASPLWVPGFGGFEPAAFPVPQVSPPVQPAGYAFAIWGPIFLWLTVSAGVGAWRHPEDPAWMKMRPGLVVSLAVGAAWLPVAVLSPVYATVMIWGMLAGALWALWLSPATQAWAAAWPVGLYAGWLSAASCVAIGLLLGGYGVLPERVAALLMVTLAGGLAFAVQWRLARAPTYGLAAIWALIAIAVNNRFELAGPGGLALGAALLLLWPTIRAVRGK